MKLTVGEHVHCASALLESARPLCVPVAHGEGLKILRGDLSRAIEHVDAAIAIDAEAKKKRSRRKPVA